MLNLTQVSKQFANGFTALTDIDLTIQPGERISLVGSSGCGKSTLLRIMAGLESPSNGEVLFNDQPIVSPHPNVGLIFQDPRLMPWLTVWDNVQFGIHHLSGSQRNQITQTTLIKVGLLPFAQHLPHQLSGGMAQRVAIARALVTKPEILLLDEPFSALDALTRMKLQEHLLQIWQYDRPTLILVTHDIEEALIMSDRIVIMHPHPGRIHQEFILDLPYPRRRTDPILQAWKEHLLDQLDLSLPTSNFHLMPV
ncbi:MAG: ABC transporter ATP-binding protein [Cyanobacteriota bacterium]|nr:ABC transporter ATP-binding protein [Cyanobacteriota bacterium]